MLIGIAIVSVIILLFLLLAKIAFRRDDERPYKYSEMRIKDALNDHYKSNICKKVTIDKISGFVFADCMEISEEGATYFAVAYIDSKLDQEEFSVLMEGVSAMDSKDASKSIIGAINKQLHA